MLDRCVMCIVNGYQSKTVAAQQVNLGLLGVVLISIKGARLIYGNRGIEMADIVGRTLESLWIDVFGYLNGQNEKARRSQEESWPPAYRLIDALLNFEAVRAESAPALGQRAGSHFLQPRSETVERHFNSSEPAQSSASTPIGGA